MKDRDVEIDLLEESRRLIADMEETYVDFIVGIDGVTANLEIAAKGFGEIAEGSVPKEIGMDKPVKVEEAVYLPELGGMTAVNSAYSVPSRTHSVKTLRSAIASGALRVEKPGGPEGRKQVLTRNLLKEYRERCQEPSSRPDSSSAPPATTAPDSSRTKPNGAFTMDQRELTRAAALMTLKGLKRS